MSSKDIRRWDLDDLTERFYTIAKKDICNYIPQNGSRAKLFAGKEMDLTLDFASCGLKYFDSKNRLLVLGRACGGSGFTPNRRVIHFDPAVSSSIKISKEAIRQTIESEISNDLDWLEAYEPKSNGEKKKRITPYLKLEKDVSEYLNPNHIGHWYDFIAYSNLFKFIPLTGGNPSKGLVLAQANSSELAEILRIEIQTLKPTHILLIVGENNQYWYPAIFKEVVDGSGTPFIKVVNRPEIRQKDIRRGILESIAEWKMDS